MQRKAQVTKLFLIMRVTYYTNSSIHIATVSVSITLAFDTRTTIWPWNSIVSLGTLFTRETFVIRWTLTLFYTTCRFSICHILISCSVKGYVG